MRKRIIIKRIICVTLCLALIICGLAVLTRLTERKTSTEKYHDFFAEKNDFDVLFLGTSHVTNGIYPMELWNDYGIVSYNMGGHGNYLPTTYWVLMNALDYTTPKLVVLDCEFLSATSGIRDVAFNHISFDAFPLSLTKIKGVFDLQYNEMFSPRVDYGDTPEADNMTVLDFLWDFDVYHARWDELTEDDFKPVCSVEKGAEYRIGVAEPDQFGYLDVRLEEETSGTVYLRKIIEECQSRGIDILLTFLPFPANYTEHMEANTMVDIANKYGIAGLNFLDMTQDWNGSGCIVDYYTDCYDSFSHLNPSGARKVTDYLGEYIINNYNIPDRRGDAAYSDWFEDYDKYNSMKEDALKEETDSENYLMLLSDKNYDTEIELTDDALLESYTYALLIRNIGLDTSTIPVIKGDSPDEKNGTARITVRNKKSGEVIDTAEFEFSTAGDIRASEVTHINDTSAG